MEFISEKELASLKQNYPEGTRVEVVRIADPHVRMVPGMRGTVMSVDDIGTLHVHWDAGFMLGVVYNEDVVRKVDEK